MILTFTFSVNPENQEAVFAGSIGIQQALSILQQLTVAELLRRNKEEQKEKVKPPE